MALVVRRPAFDFGNVGGVWNPRRPELSHALNAFQLALPYLEPYFIDAIREAEPQVRDPKLRAELEAFCEQEASHSRQHRAYTLALRAHYPRLAELELGIQQSLVRSRQQDTLEWRLGYTAAYEAITAQMARWLFRSSDKWFDGATASFRQLMTWHAAEELEHRHVAFDVLRIVAPSYRLRARTLFAALVKTMRDLLPASRYMLQVDGYAGRLDSMLRLTALRVELASEVLPAVVRYLMPGYHPSKDKEPAGFVQWQRAHGSIRDVADERTELSP